MTLCVEYDGYVWYDGYVGYAERTNARLLLWGVGRPVIDLERTECGDASACLLLTHPV
jgi:hypothetical protein